MANNFYIYTSFGHHLIPHVLVIFSGLSSTCTHYSHAVCFAYMQRKTTPLWYKSCSKPHEVTVDEGASVAIDISCTEVDSVISTCGSSLGILCCCAETIHNN